MTLRVTFEAWSPTLALGPTLEALPSVAVDVERLYALDPNQPVAFCRIRAQDLDRVERVLSRDETIASYERLERTGDASLYRLHRSETGVVQAYRHWVGANGELLDCRGVDRRWTVAMRFPDRDSFRTYHEFLEAEDVALEITRLVDGGGEESRRADRRKQVTDSQREALRVAYETGFFEVPREAQLAEIGDRLGISSQAVSERLRRGQARLIANQLL